MNYHRTLQCTLTALAAVSFQLATTLQADTTVTTDTTQSGGTFSVTPPTLLVSGGALGDPTLTLTTGATATWQGATVIGSLSGESGHLELLSASALSNTGSGNAIGNYGAVTVGNGRGYLGLNAGSQGTALVSGAGTAWTFSSYFYVGFNGTGSLTIEDGAAVSNEPYGLIGYSAGAQGTVLVTGAGSTWANGTGYLSVGGLGTGSLTVADGGAVSNHNGYIGFNTGSSGSVTVTGAGSTWTTDNILHIGDYGSALLSVADGGAVHCLKGYIGSNGTGRGTVTLNGVGTVWNISNFLYIGYVSSGNTVTVADGALVKVAGNLDISLSAGATNNYLRFKGGFLAWSGDHRTALATLLNAGKIQIWSEKTRSWENALNSVYFYSDYFATDEDAMVYTGYNGLGGCTIFGWKPNPVPLALRDSTYIGSDYYLSNWFGGFFRADIDPFSTYLYTMDFGWTWIYPYSTPASMWWWSFNMNSWLWGSEGTGRFFYRGSDGVWIYVLSDPNGGSWIYNFGTAAWSYLAL